MTENNNNNNNNKRPRECEDNEQQQCTPLKKATSSSTSTTSTTEDPQHQPPHFIAIDNDDSEKQKQSNTTTSSTSETKSNTSIPLPFPYFIEDDDEDDDEGGDLPMCTVCGLETNTPNYPLYLCDSSDCDNSFHFDCARYTKALKNCEYTYSLCGECKSNTGLTNEDIYHFEDEYFAFHEFAQSNNMELINIENDGKCIFAAVFYWMPLRMRQKLHINTITDLITRSVDSLLSMIGGNELPIVEENYEDLVMDLSLLASDSSTLCDIWNRHYESGLGIGDYFISSLERCLEVGIRVYQYLDSQVLVRQQSHQFENEINVVIRAEKFAAHYDLLLPKEN